MTIRFFAQCKATLAWAAFLAFTMATGAAVHDIHIMWSNDLLYRSSGDSRIGKDHGQALEAMTVCAPGGVGAAGARLEFGRLLSEIQGQYPDEEIIKLSKSGNPLCAMMGLCLLDGRRYSDYILRFKDDRRRIRFRSGCTINKDMSIGDIITTCWRFEAFVRQHRFEILLFGRILPDGDA
jgi:hypothetical protein